MNTKVALAKEILKSAAYIFVIAGLVSTTSTQLERTRAAFRVVSK